MAALFGFFQTEDDGFSPVLAPKPKDAPKEETVDNSPLKAASSGSARGTPTTSKSTKGKRKTNGDDAKASNGGGPAKKVKTENVHFSFLMNLLDFISSVISILTHNPALTFQSLL